MKHIQTHHFQTKHILSLYVKISIIDMKNNSNFTCLNKKFAENCGWFDEDILQQVVMNELLVTGLKPVLDTTENLRFSWLELIECIWGDINLADFEQDRYLDSLLLTRYVLNISLITFQVAQPPVIPLTTIMYSVCTMFSTVCLHLVLVNFNNLGVTKLFVKICFFTIVQIFYILKKFVFLAMKYLNFVKFVHEIFCCMDCKIKLFNQPL